MVKVKVIGAGGFGGAGMIELVLRHPEARLHKLLDIENVGSPISKVWPHFEGCCDLVIESPDADTPGDGEDVVFLATPDRVGMKLAPAYVKAGVKVVDYSGDFRFRETKVYAGYATRIGKETTHLAAELLPKCVYGLAELHRAEIAKASVVGNPGCFAVAATLGFYPAAKEKVVDVTSLVSDAKTGVSGAGKKPQPTFHYPLRYDNMNAYKVARHQHCYEIEHELSQAARTTVHLTLTTQVVPVCRGIMACCYGRLDAGWVDAKKLTRLYRDTYAGEPFVHVVGPEGAASSSDVRGTNLAKLWVHCDPTTGQMIVISHIDNLMKGQASNAVQNMNIMFGLEESAGLELPGQFP
jgi:N-acetyl-gamma-glutamyl-phosphate reductase